MDKRYMKGVTNHQNNVNEKYREIPLLPVRVHIIKKDKNKQLWSWIRRNESLHTVGRMQNVAAISCKTAWRFLKILKVKVGYHPANLHPPLHGVLFFLSKISEVRNLKRYWHCCNCDSTFHNCHGNGTKRSISQVNG